MRSSVFNMKNLIFILFIICSTSACSQIEPEKELFQSAQSFTTSGNYYKAENVFRKLILNYPDSEKVGEYYLAQDKLFVKIIDQLRKNNVAESHAKLKKGTIRIGFGPMDEGEIAKVQQKRMKELEHYLKKYPNGVEREKIQENLVTIYTVNDKEKLLKIANEMITFKEPQKQKKGFMFKAIIKHGDGKFIEALNSYKMLQDICKEEAEKAKYQLYMSDCYYRLNEQDLAMESLEKVDFYEMKFEKKYMSRMAALWKDSYKKEFEKPIEKREQFVFFR